ncbi:hypothetical protein [Bathymodiolus thermophilus thioautotrophic gill symbiont]|nr:hypothetical protein [Bathymodiolus thermophilus thioautotrophic gill symbiont]
MTILILFSLFSSIVRGKANDTNQFFTYKKTQNIGVRSIPIFTETFIPHTTIIVDKLKQRQLSNLQSENLLKIINKNAKGKGSSGFDFRSVRVKIALADGETIYLDKYGQILYNGYLENSIGLKALSEIDNLLENIMGADYF